MVFLGVVLKITKNKGVQLTGMHYVTCQEAFHIVAGRKWILWNIQKKGWYITQDGMRDGFEQEAR